MNTFPIGVGAGSIAPMHKAKGIHDVIAANHEKKKRPNTCFNGPSE